jgi:BMFP domain-containing protein YqiC
LFNRHDSAVTARLAALEARLAALEAAAAAPSTPAPTRNGEP